MTTNQYGPKTVEAENLHAMKYRGPGEDFREAMNRVAFALKDGDAHYHEFREILLNQRFCPGGRIQAAMGATRRTTAYNCFVSGTLADTFVDGQESIMGRAHQAAATMRMGGGIGYDFSTLRPRGFRVVRIDSQASGPVSFMPVFDAVCLATASFGHRRGAQMGVLRCDHPDIEEFVGAKQNDTALKGFNVSVAVTDKLMEAVARGSTFWLQWKGDDYKEVDAAALWERIMRSTWDWAEPGVLFIDTINRMNNLHYCETIAATNPCGEQPLPPYGACLLGSFNLTKYLRPPAATSHFDPSEPPTTRYDFDYDQLITDVPACVRAMDNVVDRTIYPLAEQRGEAISKRRMGIGVMGLANAGEALGYSYGSPGFLAFEARVLQTINVESYRASAALAAEKDSFPLFDAERYLRGEFVKTLPDDVRDLIARNGIRNSHLTSIAPTGTISMTCDNISSGVEPVFSHETERSINTPDGVMKSTLRDYGVGFLGVRGKLSRDVTADEHVDVLVTAQRFVDSAVSKTCNVSPDMSWDSFKDIYLRTYSEGGKGCTTFNSGGKRFALLVEAKPVKDEGEGLPSCEIDGSGRRSCE